MFGSTQNFIFVIFSGSKVHTEKQTNLSAPFVQNLATSEIKGAKNSILRVLKSATHQSVISLVTATKGYTIFIANAPWVWWTPEP